MHYIRLLRAPKLTFQKEKGKKHPWSLNIVLTVTTDLGDSFLVPDEPVKIKVVLGWELPRSEDANSMKLAGEKTLQWTSGMRVLKADFPAIHLEPTSTLPAGETPLRVWITAGPRQYAGTAETIAMAGFNNTEDGKIVPLWANVEVPGSEAPTTCLRRIRLGRRQRPFIEVEEDIGESIARHVWDAGMMVVSRLWLLCEGDSSISAGHPLSMTTLQSLLVSEDTVNILELGCGVGIFGIGLARMLSQRHDSSKKGRIVMTDLPEAEERACTNINILDKMGIPSIRPEYENLDWDDGRDGDFGPLVKDTFWDLVVLSDCTYNADALPALIDTWTAIHKQNVALRPKTEQVATRVLVAMKVRHSDEDRLWQLVEENGWAVTEQTVMPLLMLGGEPQEIFLYLFENKKRAFS
ncbi:upf0665 family protein c [Colletotrichum truncatum]|uniref:Upf0665 family protein c n=1 Tax=Colletotrichum truncatum TaxID=5467 RepID=A0ACC3YQF4_COLTU|nr:upf0665 family protein c [Colletotrichum truncatum]KAF6796612.1 upf0665 family protein c [Colletotrichum truncatum]